MVLELKNHQKVKKEMSKEFDIVIMAAAISDYTPENSSKNKIKSIKNKIKISLKKAPKIIDQIKKYQKNVFLVGFKAEINLSKNELITLAKKKMNESDADMIVANDIGSIRYRKNPESNEVLVIDSHKVISSGWVKKEKIAKFIKKEQNKKISEKLKEIEHKYFHETGRTIQSDFKEIT